MTESWSQAKLTEHNCMLLSYIYVYIYTLSGYALGSNLDSNSSILTANVKRET